MPDGLHFNGATRVLEIQGRDQPIRHTVDVIVENVLVGSEQLFSKIEVAIEACGEDTCNGGVCQYDEPGDSCRYEQTDCFTCVGCPDNRLGPRCEHEGFRKDGLSGVGVGLSIAFLVVGLVAAVWWSRTSMVKLDLYERLLSKQDEVSALQQVWQIEHSELELGDEIAQGSFGKVVRGRWGDIGVAVKFVHQSLLALSDEAADEFAQESSFMKSMRHVSRGGRGRERINIAFIDYLI